MNIGFTYISMANTTFTQKSNCLPVETLLCQANSKVHHCQIHHFRFNSKIKYNCFSVQEQKILGLRLQNDPTRKMNMAVYANLPAGDSFPVDPSPGNWKIWIAGTIVTVVLSFITKGKWGPLLQLEEKIETTIDEAERVADIVEDVAERVDKVAEEAVKNLPKGKLRDAAEFIEKAAENVDKFAENTGELLEKVEDVEKEVESFFEATNNQEKNIVVTADLKDQK